MADRPGRRRAGHQHDPYIALGRDAGAHCRRRAAAFRRGNRSISYGPYRRDGHAFADSNRAFDQSLRHRDPEWGIRRMEDVAATAAAAGFDLARDRRDAGQQSQPGVPAAVISNDL
ncbi:MAG: DUF938 domain-containing protein [Aliidongia sp.]